MLISGFLLFPSRLLIPVPSRDGSKTQNKADSDSTDLGAARSCSSLLRQSSAPHHHPTCRVLSYTHQDMRYTPIVPYCVLVALAATARCSAADATTSGPQGLTFTELLSQGRRGSLAYLLASSSPPGTRGKEHAASVADVAPTSYVVPATTHVVTHAETVATQDERREEAGIAGTQGGGSTPGDTTMPAASARRQDMPLAQTSEQGDVRSWLWFTGMSVMPTAAQRAWLARLYSESQALRPGTGTVSLAYKSGSIRGLLKMSHRAFRRLAAESEASRIAMLADLDKMAFALRHAELLAAARLHGQGLLTDFDHRPGFVGNVQRLFGPRPTVSENIYINALKKMAQVRGYAVVLYEVLNREWRHAVQARTRAEKKVESAKAKCTRAAARPGSARRAPELNSECDKKQDILERAREDEKLGASLRVYAASLLKMMAMAPHTDEYKEYFGTDYTRQARQMAYGEQVTMVQQD